MTISTNPILEFEEAIQPFLAAFRSLDIRAICDLKNDRLLSMIACLTPNEARPAEAVDQLVDIAFIKGALPSNELNRVLAEWRTGSLRLGRYRLDTGEFNTPRFHALNRNPSEDLEHAWPEYNSFSRLHIQSWGPRALEVMVAPRDIWAAARLQGFTDFGELAVERLRFDVGGGKVARLNLFAPVLISIDGQAGEGEARFRLRHHTGLGRESLRLTYRVQDEHGDKLDSRQIEGSDLGITTQGDFHALAGSIALPARSARVEVSVYFFPYKAGTEPVAACHFDVPREGAGENPRWMLLKSVITNTRTWTKVRSWTTPEETLKQWLGMSASRPDSEDFERGVQCLLFLSGYSSLHLAGAEGVDVILVETEPTKLGAVVSCTTSSNISGKISDLQLQTNRARDMLPEFTVLPAVFAPVEMRDLPVGAIEDCQAQNIKLMLKPELKAIYDKVTGRDWARAQQEVMPMLITSRSVQRV